MGKSGTFYVCSVGRVAFISQSGIFRVLALSAFRFIDRLGHNPLPDVTWRGREKRPVNLKVTSRSHPVHTKDTPRTNRISRIHHIHRRRLNLSPSKHGCRRRSGPSVADVWPAVANVWRRLDGWGAGQAAGMRWDGPGGEGAGNFTAHWFTDWLGDWLIDWLTGWPFWGALVSTEQTFCRRPVDRQLLIFPAKPPPPRRSQMAVVTVVFHAGVLGIARVLEMLDGVPLMVVGVLWTVAGDVGIAGVLGW